MSKVNILKIFLVFFIVSTGIFAWLLFTEEKSPSLHFTPDGLPLPPGVVLLPYDGDITLGGIATTTDRRDKDSPYKKINYVYAKKDGVIYYAEPTMRLTDMPVYTEVEGVDTETFTITETVHTQLGLASDKDHIFFDGEIVDVDKPSFEVLTNWYFKDKDYIYHVESYKYDYSLVRLERDIPTFRIFVTGGPRSDYTLDKNGVYYAGEKIPDIDSDTFSVVSSPAEIALLNGKGGPDLSGLYMRDLNNIVYRGKVLPGADVASFKPIFTGPYIQEFGKDKSNVYYESSLVTGADPETFTTETRQVYEGCRLGMYGVDSGAVYYKEMKVNGADQETFKSLYGEYGKDKNNVYLRGVLQEGLNPQTFTFDCDYG
ncbi:MAG: DKNYY domain-containing protein [Parcubacteria group bacterium]|nr:DKNYY domain-containing protein [Parcubacteria group bacterium]MCR4342402.1 DKNYY domain-containing protein [Patescibacteria group bacterium]